MEIRNIIVFCATALLSTTISCSKEWIPTPDPSQTKWTNQGPESDDPTPEPEPSEKWTEITDAKVALGETKVAEQTSSTFMKGYWPDGKLIPMP